jgi:hypothetical protein
MDSSEMLSKPSPASKLYDSAKTAALTTPSICADAVPGANARRHVQAGIHWFLRIRISPG